MRRSTFHGVALGSGVDLPLAWNRTKAPKPLYKRAGGALSPVAGALAEKTWVPVEETGVTEDGRAFLPVRGAQDTFVLADDVTISRARRGLPKGVEPDEKWIEVKILPGTLTAYEGERPVYATLVSPGKGGAPAPGLDHTRYATTATGFFPIEWKDRVDTMSSEPREPRVMWFTDVPHIQYLRAPLAMHVALWHEDFGNPKSAECVNVSPEDGHFLFGWTDPALPEGWGGIRPGSGNGKSTPVVVTAQ
jgi:L,D-transpeptidase catalytic domain